MIVNIEDFEPTNTVEHDVEKVDMEAKKLADRAAFKLEVLGWTIERMTAALPVARHAVTEQFDQGYLLDSFRIESLIVAQENATVAAQAKQLLEADGIDALRKFTTRTISFFSISRGSSQVSNLQDDAKHEAWLQIFKALEEL